MDQNNKSSMTGMAIVILVVGLVIGFGVTKAMDNNHYKKLN